MLKEASMSLRRLSSLQRNQASANKAEDTQFFENGMSKESKSESGPSEIWLAAKEAANYLCVSLGALRNMTSNGEIPHYKLGRRVRYLKSELRTLLMANKRGV